MNIILVLMIIGVVYICADVVITEAPKIFNGKNSAHDRVDAAVVCTMLTVCAAGLILLPFVLGLPF